MFMRKNQLHLWGERITIRQSESLNVYGNAFSLHEVAASDDTRAVVMICSEPVLKDTTDVPSFIEDALAARGLQGVFVNDKNHVFLESVSPLHTEVMRRFIGQRAGIIVLVNGQEPGGGAHSLREMTLHKGDMLEVLYRIGS